MEELRDIRFQYEYDNPFSNDTNKTKLNQFKQYMKLNSNKFIFNTSPLEEIRYLSIKPNISTLFNVSVKNNKSIESNPIVNEIKKFIANSPEITSPALKQWAGTPSANVKEEIPPPAQESESDSEPEAAEEKTIDDIQYDPASFTIIPNIATKYAYSKTGGLQNYDISSDKQLSFDDIRKLTLNIARSKLVPDIQKDENIMQLEKEKKKILINEINKYKRLREISAIVDDDLSELDISALENIKDNCVRLHERQKLIEVCKKGVGIGGTIYNSIFPEGIKISSTKRIKLKGVGKQLLETLFDGGTCTGISFLNMIEKKNIHISDNMLLVLSVANIVFNKVEVEDVSKPPEPTPTSPPPPSSQKQEETSEYEEEEDYEEDEKE